MAGRASSALPCPRLPGLQNQPHPPPEDEGRAGSPEGSEPAPCGDGARGFLKALGEWYERWRTWLSEKSTYVSESTGELYKDWTHKRVRRCYTRLARLSRAGQLFCFLDPALSKACGVKHLPRNSNRLEGGINAPIKRMLTNHRGMPESHILRACEWMCWKHSGRPLPPIKDMLRKAKSTPPKGGEDYLPGWGTGVQWSDFHTETRYPNATN